MPTLASMTAKPVLDGTELAYVELATGVAGDERKTTTSAFKDLALEDFSANGLSLVTLTYAAMRAALDLEPGTDFNAYSANLAALSAQASTGLIARAGSGTYTTRTLTAPAAGITVSNGDGVSGNPTLALADDLAALEALSGTNTIYYRSAANTWSAVMIGSGLDFTAGSLTSTGSGGTVTHTVGALTANQLVFGNGSADVKAGNLTGDVTTSGGTATTIANDAVTTAKILNANVTLAKIANAAANSKLLGSGAAGSGSAYTELSLGTGLSFSGTTLDISVTDALGYTPLKAGKHTIPVMAGAMNARTTNGAGASTTETATNKIMVRTLDFDQTAVEYAQAAVPMPKSWDLGTITAQFIWSCGVTGDVVWAIQGVAISDDDVLDASFGTAVTVTDSVTATTDQMVSAETSAVTIGGTPAAKDTVVFQVYRDATNGADTAAGDAKLIGVRLYITLNAADDA